MFVSLEQLLVEVLRVLARYLEPFFLLLQFLVGAHNGLQLDAAVYFELILEVPLAAHVPLLCEGLRPVRQEVLARAVTLGRIYNLETIGIGASAIFSINRIITITLLLTLYCLLLIGRSGA